MKLFSIIALLFCIITADAWPCTGLIIEANQGDAPFIKAINHAQHQIDLVMYGFTDRHIRTAIIRAHERGVKVRVMLEYSPYLSNDENRFTIQVLKHHHIIIKDSNPKFRLTHQKTLIIDHKSAWIMTLNFTYSAFHTQRNFAVIDTSAQDIEEIETVFNADWHRAALKQTHNRLLWSPRNMRHELITLIQSAKHRIDIYAMALSDYKLIGSLAKAAKRHVAVRILMTQSMSGAIKTKLRYLKRQGVMIHLNQTPIIHAKVILVDHSRAYLGSANFTTPSLDHNRELGVIIQNPDILHQLSIQFEKDWRSA